MSLAADLSTARDMLSADAATMRAIVQGPATGTSSIVTLSTGQSVKTLSRIASELTGGYLPMAGGTLSGTLKAPNFLIGNELATDAGTIGFTNTNGPGLIFGGSASAFGASLIGIIGGVERFRATATGFFTAPTGHLGFSANGFLAAASDGVWALYNNDATDFGRLQFGGTSSAFPSLKRNGPVLEAKLADDSAFANFGAAGVLIKSAAVWSLDTTAAAQTIANGSTFNLPAGAGLIVLSNDTTGAIGLFLCGGGSVALIGQSSTDFVAGVPGSGKIGLEWNGSSAYRINNNSGGSRLIGISSMRSRTAG